MGKGIRKGVDMDSLLEQLQTNVTTAQEEKRKEQRHRANLAIVNLQLNMIKKSKEGIDYIRFKSCHSDCEIASEINREVGQHFYARGFKVQFTMCRGFYEGTTISWAK